MKKQPLKKEEQKELVPRPRHSLAAGKEGDLTHVNVSHFLLTNDDLTGTNDKETLALTERITLLTVHPVIIVIAWRYVHVNSGRIRPSKTNRSNIG